MTSGVQVIVPTEHGFHNDLSELIKSLDYSSARCPFRAVSTTSKADTPAFIRWCSIQTDSFGGSALAGMAQAQHGRSRDILPP